MDLITTQNLTRRFDGLVAVNQVNFNLKKGQFIGIIGPNGSGKTTLFNLLSGFLPPSEGKITFDSKDITKIPAYKRVEMGMARTFQLVSVFDSLTVWENLVLSTIKLKGQHQTIHKFFLESAHKKTIVDGCLKSLEMVGLIEKAYAFTSELSYGEKRMLEIAISLSLEPRVLLLDEPLSGLSDYEIGEVLDLIHLVKESFALVIIEHKISRLVGLVEKLYVMNEGRILCEGDPEQVLHDPAVRECYWGKEK